MGANGALTPRQRRFLAAVIATPDVRTASKASGVSERTCWRYLADPAVRSELSRRQDAVIGGAARRLAERMDAAVHVLSAIMASPTELSAVRVSAAKAILDAGLRLAELVSLQDRVSALETAQGGQR